MTIEKQLFNARDAAEYLGGSERWFHELRKKDPTFPKPRDLGPRSQRWPRAELDAWIAALPSVEERKPEPLRLRAARASSALSMAGDLEAA